MQSSFSPAMGTRTAYSGCNVLFESSQASPTFKKPKIQCRECLHPDTKSQSVIFV